MRGSLLCGGGEGGRRGEDSVTPTRWLKYEEPRVWGTAGAQHDTDFRPSVDPVHIDMDQNGMQCRTGDSVELSMDVDNRMRTIRLPSTLRLF
jgi:hypothetical protein